MVMQLAELDKIRQLRALTHCSLSDCKQTLDACGWDLDKAFVKIVQQSADKLAPKPTLYGIVGTYNHLDKIGAIVLLRCESPFVASLPSVRTLAHSIAQQVAAADPQPDLAQGKSEVQVLLDMQWIGDPQLTIQDLVNTLRASTKEQIVVEKFHRLQVLGG